MRARAGLGALAVALLAFAAAAPASAAEEVELPAQRWPFEGVFGIFDRAQLQRGLQVYLEVCRNCHSLDLVAYRNLEDLGYDEEGIKAIAAQFEVEDGPDEAGEMFLRPARPSDRFVAPYPNKKAAAAANAGAAPPDLSLMYKARLGGADYIYALLTGYGRDPGDFQVQEGLHYNPYFPARQIAMPQPLYGGDVAYADGAEASIEQEARDVTTFLAWAAEPSMEGRKRLGLQVILYTLVLTALLYASKRKVWRDLH